MHAATRLTLPCSASAQAATRLGLASRSDVHGATRLGLECGAPAQAATRLGLAC
jgi:hypothetical protein